MKESRCVHWIRKALSLGTAAALLVTGLLVPAAPAAAAGCPAGQVEAIYYNWDATNKVWVQAATQCESGPAAGSFARDYTAAGALPAGVNAAQFKVTYSGSLPAAIGWASFSATGDTGGLTASVDGLAVPSGAPYVYLNAANAFSAAYEKTGTATFALTWAGAPAVACTADQVFAVYQDPVASSRLAKVVRCEAGPSGGKFERKSADLPNLTGAYRATYTGQLPISEAGWYQFTAKTAAGDSLAAVAGGEDLFPSPATSGYLELTTASPALAAIYSHDGTGAASFAMEWVQFKCDTGLFLAAYYDGAALKGRAGTVRCEPMPDGVALGSAGSAKWTGKVYLEDGAYSVSGTSGGKLSVDGGSAVSVGGATGTIAEGLHTLSFTYKPGETTFAATVTNQGTGRALPPCPEGLYARKPTDGSAPTCTADLTGDASYKGRMWLQAGTYAVSGTNTQDLTLDQQVPTAAVTLAEGTHDLAFSATGGASVQFLLTGGCPEGAFLSEYRDGGADGAVAFRACEPRPEYAWGAGRPPGVSGAFFARWTGNVALDEAGLYTFTTAGDAGRKFGVQQPDGNGGLQSVPVSYAGGAADLLPNLYSFTFEQATSAASPVAKVGWTTPSGAAALACPDGYFRAEYFSGSLSGQPYLVTCEAQPYLTYRRTWAAGAPAPYAVRWSGRMLLDPGVHSLKLSASGNATLYVDGAVAATNSTADGITVSRFDWDMARGYHQVTLEYTGGGELDFVRLQRSFTEPVPGGGGSCAAGLFTVQWFAGTGLAGTPAAVTCESGPPDSFSGLTPPADLGADWSARWTGTVSFPAGRYRFGILARNAVRVLVSGTPVVEEFTFTRPKEDGSGDESFPNRPLWTNGIHRTDGEVNFDTSGARQVVIEYATSATRASGVDPAAVPGAGLRVWWEAAGAPALIGAGFTASDTLQLRYDSALDAATAPGDASFLVRTIDEAPLVTASLSISGTRASIHLTNPVPDGDQVIVRYDPTVAGALRGQAAPLRPLTDLAAGKTAAGSVAWPVDLGDVYALSELKLFGADASYEPFQVQVSLDGAHWQTVYTHAATGPINSSGRPYLYVQSAGAARWIRIVSQSAAAVPSAAVQAWGAPMGNPAAAPSPLSGTNPINVALGKTAAMAGGTNPAHPASLGTNGYITKQIINDQDVPDYFESPANDDPWWQVDLGGSYLVSSIRVYNRADCCQENATGIILETSADGVTWENVDVSAEPFGGAYAAPYLRADLPERKAAYVRVRLAGTGKTLALAEVQVYGVPAVPSLIVTNDLAMPTLRTDGVDPIQVIDDVVTFRYNKPMDSAAVPVPADFAVRVDGATYTPVAVQVFGSDVTLYLPRRTDPTMIVGVRYTPSATGGPVLQDVSGNKAAAIDFTEAKYQAVVPVNLALLKPAMAGGGIVATDHPASNGVNGVRYFTNENGGSKVYDYFSITGTGTAPYWQVDLKDVYSLTKLRLFNRYDGTPADKQMADNLQVRLSVDGTRWQTVYINPQQRTPSPTFGLTEGEFLGIPLYYDNARYVRIALPDSGTLSLAEVQVYGLPAIQTWNVAGEKPATATTSVGTYTEWGLIHLGEQPPAGHGADAAYNPARANDRDASTYALLTPAGAGGQGTWQVDLHKSYTLDRVNLLLADAAAVTAFLGDSGAAVEISADGSAWSSVLAGSNVLHEANRISVAVPAADARFLRVRTSLATLRLYEVEAVGFPTTDLEEQRPLPNLAHAMPASLVAAAGQYAQWENRYLSAPAPGTVLPANSPAWAVDGNTQTYAELSPLASPDPACGCKAAWTVDLQKPHPVTKAVIRFASAADAAAFRTQGHIRISADGAAWTEVSMAGAAMVADQEQWLLIVPLPGTMAQFLQVSSDSIDPLKLYEVEVYGYELMLTR
jgi:uncharacterized repeat protein (TIGR02059 family)